MRYRPLSPTGDYTIGQSFYTNNAQAVSQAVNTRMKLWLAEWFLDLTDGTPYFTQVLGERYNKQPDAALKRRMLGTPGVTQLISYTSQYVGGASRTYQVNASLQTQYSVTPVAISIPLGISV